LDKPVFRGNLINGVTEAYSAITLPAMPYELQDFMERAHLEHGAECCIEITDFTQFPFLRPYLEDASDLYAMNALAQKLATMEPWQADAFEGLLLMEGNKAETEDHSSLYDLAASTGECQVLYEVRTDEELGRFYVENGFVKETEGIDEALYALLDYRRIGEQMRRGEGGVFLREGTGYVTLDGELKEEFKTLDLTPVQPDYTVLLEVGQMDSGDSVMLKLPLSRRELEAVPDHFEARGWCDLTWRCADCRIPALRDFISTTDNIVFINFAAQQLDEIPEEQLKGCKALIAAMQPKDLTAATALLEHMDEYIFSPQIDAPDTLARAELLERLGEHDAALVIPYVNLYAYGTRLMEENQQALTAYGMIERSDYQPLLTLERQFEAKQNGMEVMQM